MPTSAPRGWTPNHPTFKESSFDPYALAIGRIALAWNDLNERLAELFWTVMGGGFMDRIIGVWNSANFDRPRREMLKAAAAASTPRELERFPKMPDEVKWLCDRAEDFENIRNDAVHSPLFLTVSTIHVLFGMRTTTSCRMPSCATRERRGSWARTFFPSSTGAMPR